MKRIKSKPVDMRAFTCPQCNKRRMIRRPDHIVSLEKEEHMDRGNKPISLFVDTCEFCKIKNFKKHFEPTKSDIRKVINAMKDNDTKGQSLEDML